MEKYKGKTFADLESREVQYEDKKYKVWDIEVRPGEIVIFAEDRLLVAFSEDGDDYHPIESAVACFVNPNEDVNETIKRYLG